MNTDVHTLSGAYAINALSSDEADLFRAHLDACPACRQEVRELEAAAAQMGSAESLAPPADLKARVIAAAERAPQLPPEREVDRLVADVESTRPDVEQVHRAVPAPAA